VPPELRTDRLSAASRNRDGSYALAITPRYQALCAHYGLAPSRNNRGVAHENGIVEAPHGNVKRRLEQKLLLRGSCDFEEPAEYGERLAEVFSALNAPRQRRYEQELEHLMALSAFRFADYELLTVRVRSIRSFLPIEPQRTSRAGEQQHSFAGVWPSPPSVRGDGSCTFQPWLLPPGPWSFIPWLSPAPAAVIAGIGTS